MGIRIFYFDIQHAVEVHDWIMENIAVWLAEGKISKDLLAEIIESLVYEEDYSEELKLKIAIAVS